MVVHLLHDVQTCTFPPICIHSLSCRTSILEDAIPRRAIETYYHCDFVLWDFFLHTCELTPNAMRTQRSLADPQVELTQSARHTSIPVPQRRLGFRHPRRGFRPTRAMRWPLPYIEYGFRFGQLGQETPGLRRPSASHFQGKHHKTGSSVDSHKLWVRACLPLSCCCQSHSINIGSTSPRGPISPECTHQRRVQRKLCSSKQVRAIRHNFETSSIIGRDSAPCLSANPPQHALQSKPSLPLNSTQRSRSTVVADTCSLSIAKPQTSKRERQRGHVVCVLATRGEVNLEDSIVDTSILCHCFWPH